MISRDCDGCALQQLASNGITKLGVGGKVFALTETLPWFTKTIQLRLVFLCLGCLV